MSARTQQVIGFVLLISAVVISILNLKRVSNLGMMWLPALLLVIGILLVTTARRRG